MIEIDAATDRQLRIYSKELFADMLGDKDYPYKKWEEQYEECRTLFKSGGMSREFLNFATEGGEREAHDA